MKILFIGSYIPLEMSKEYKKYISIAGNKFQEKFINNYTLFGDDIEILSYIPYPRFPIGKKILVREKKYNNINYIKYINISGLKEISICLSCFIFLLKNFKKYDLVLTYNLFLPYLKAAIIMKKIFNFKLGSIIADIYIDDYKYESFFKKIYKKQNFKKEIKALNKLDFCIPITKKIIEDFKFTKSYMVLEGGVETNYATDGKKKEHNVRKKIVYTGTIDSVNGIEVLIDVAKSIDPQKYEIIIAGDGPLLNYLKEEVSNRVNVKICGRISNEEAINLQREADLLILTRPTNQKITRYTFPSKLHEYMSTEVPVLITKLSGIGDEYYKYLNVIEKNEASSIIKNIDEIFSNYSAHKEKARQGKQYLLESKTWEKQTKRVFIFLNEFMKRSRNE